MVWRSELLGTEIDPSPTVTRSPLEFAYVIRATTTSMHISCRPGWCMW